MGVNLDGTRCRMKVSAKRLAAGIEVCPHHDGFNHMTGVVVDGKHIPKGAPMDRLADIRARGGRVERDLRLRD
ncbi:MAG TPA: hypothetical protein VEQ37_12470 [Actinomycetota bacterium]|nr:hypothetical protein [Actinomycetota bacterium]